MDQIYCYTDQLILRKFFSLFNQICLPQFSFGIYPVLPLILSKPFSPRLLPFLTPNQSYRETEKAEELIHCSKAGSNVSVYFVIATGSILGCMDHCSEPVWPFLNSPLAEMSSTCLHLTCFLIIT